MIVCELWKIIFTLQPPLFIYKKTIEYKNDFDSGEIFLNHEYFDGSNRIFLSYLKPS